eukprot:5931014-Amphidinium_carterae.1
MPKFTMTVQKVVLTVSFRSMSVLFVVPLGAKAAHTAFPAHSSPKQFHINSSLCFMAKQCSSKAEFSANDQERKHPESVNPGIPKNTPKY